MPSLPIHSLTREQVAVFEHRHASMLVDLARAREHHWPDEGVQLVEIGDGVVQFYRRDRNWSRAYLFGMTQPVTDEIMDDLEAAFEERGMVPQVEMNLYADPSLGEQFGKRGYAPSEWAHCLLRPLRGGEEFPRPAEGIEVEVIDPDTGFDRWNEVYSSGFTDPGDEEFLNPETHKPLQDLPYLHYFLAHLNGEPAGGACMAVFQDLAYFVGASTREPLRRRGVQTALINRRFEAAQELGCQAATIYCGMGTSSQRNAERFGFHIIYSQGLYKRLPRE